MVDFQPCNGRQFLYNGSNSHKERHSNQIAILTLSGLCLLVFSLLGLCPSFYRRVVIVCWFYKSYYSSQKKNNEEKEGTTILIFTEVMKFYMFLTITYKIERNKIRSSTGY
jgi:hypothetical protein